MPINVDQPKPEGYDAQESKDKECTYFSLKILFVKRLGLGLRGKGNGPPVSPKEQNCEKALLGRVGQVHIVNVPLPSLDNQQ